jgi:murein hydrolase activator
VKHTTRYIPTLAVASILAIACTHAHASPPELDTRKQQLQGIKENLQKTENKHALTQAQLRRLEREIEAAQEDILAKAAEIHKVEQALATQQREVKQLFETEAKQNQALTNTRRNISHMASAAWSIQYRPQLAAWLLPEETRQRALASRALHMATLSLKHDMDKANLAMLDLQKLRQTILDKQRANEVLQQTLQAERKTLQESTAGQQKRIAELRQHETSYSAQIKELTAKSRNLEGLIGKLEVARAERAKREEAQKQAAAAKKPDKTPSVAQPERKPDRPRAASFAASKGALPLPAQGTITGTFGQARGNNDRLKGMEIKTIKGAIVTTPYEGEVLFTGPFLEYGNMAIIRHSQDYHTLVAGLSRIDVSVGQFLLDGEPIGAMGEGNDQRNLYLELRKSSQAINPQPWFAVQKHHYATR